MSIDQVLKSQFTDQVHVLAQQKLARTMPYVKYKPFTGEEAFYDRLDAVEDYEVIGRNQKVNFVQANWDRRKMVKRRFTCPIPVDSDDINSMMADPKSELAKVIVAAMKRRFDRISLAAAFADVKVGRNGESTLTFAQDGGLTVDATAGLTYEKLLELNRNFIDNEVGNEDPVKKVLTISGDEHEALMKENELTSGDFSRQMAVDNGEIIKAAGFDLLRFGDNVNKPILPRNTAGTERELIAMAQGAICVGIASDIDLKIQERTDLIETHQVIATYTLGAVRTEGKLIQKVRVAV